MTRRRAEQEEAFGLMCAESAKQGGCVRARGGCGAGAAWTAFAQGKIQRCSPLSIRGVELRSVHSQQFDHGIHRQGGEVKRGLARVIGRVHIDMLLQQHFHRFKHLGLGGVFFRKRAQAAAQSGRQHERCRMVFLLNRGIRAELKQ